VREIGEPLAQEGGESNTGAGLRSGRVRSHPPAV